MGGAELICPAYDPITSSCAPSCCVCSQNDKCVMSMYERLNPASKEACNAYISELLSEQKRAALGATNTQNGKARTTANDSAIIIHDAGKGCKHE